VTYNSVAENPVAVYSKSGMMRQKSLTTIDIRHTEDLVTIALLTKSVVDDPVDDRFIVMSILSGAGYSRRRIECRWFFS
jgi:hypothetical protein